MNRWFPLSGYIAVLICCLFAFRALLLVDASGLWSDELYSVGKSFESNPSELLAILRKDTHPPFYYGLLWVWGQIFGQNPIILRVFSWLVYVAGGIVIVAQAKALAGRQQVISWAAILAFCSPYPIRFSIEGKSYALMVLLLALAWWWRRLNNVGSYFLAVSLASLTHFYGLFIFMVTAVWDSWRGKRRLGISAALGVIPALGWVIYSRDYLFSSHSGSWLVRPEFSLFEDTLARGLGIWPLPKLALILLTIVLLFRWGCFREGCRLDVSLLDQSGVIPSALMVLVVVCISFVKPIAFSRYFVVLLPALVPWIAVQLESLEFNSKSRLLLISILSLMLVSWWVSGFTEIAPDFGGAREQDEFRLISQQSSGIHYRYSPRAHLLNISDRMELSMGRIPSPQRLWGDQNDLERRLEISPPPSMILLATTGPAPMLRQKFVILYKFVEDQGYKCSNHSLKSSNAVLVQCLYVSRGP